MTAASDWQEFELGELLTLINGRAYKQDELLDAGTPVLRIQNLNGGERWYYSDLSLPADKMCDAGDLLYAWSGSFGPYVWSGPKSIYHYHIWKIALTNRLDQRFAYYLLEHITARVKAAGRGVSMLHMTKSGMEAWKVRVPPLEEQKRIAAILDQADALRRLRARALDRLNTLGQAIFHEMFGDGTAPRATLPLSELLDVRSSLDDPRLPENRTLLHVGPEHIVSGSGAVSWTKVQTCEEDGVQSGKYHFQAGDIIFSKIRPYLNKVAIADRKGMCSADMYALVVDKARMTTEFMHFVLGSAEFLRFAGTVSNRANIPKMNRSQLLGFECPVPDLQGQQLFKTRIEELRGVSSVAGIHLTRSETLFTSLQHRAFRGEL